MLLRCRTRRAERTSSRCSHVFARLLHWRALVKKAEPWQLPKKRHQFQSQSSLFKRSRVSTRRTQNHRLLCQPQCQPHYCLKWLGLSPQHSERCHHSVNKDHLARVRNIGVTSAPWRGTATRLCKNLHSSSCSSHPSATILKTWTDHTAHQTHRRPQTIPHYVFPPQTCAQISNLSKEKISDQVCGTIAVLCWKTKRSKQEDKNHPVPCGGKNSLRFVALDLKAAFQNVSRKAMLFSIAQTSADLAAVFSKSCTGTTENRMHTDFACTKISANSGVDQGCPLSACGFSANVDPILRSVMAQLCTPYDSGAKLFAYLDDWYLRVKQQCL